LRGGEYLVALNVERVDGSAVAPPQGEWMYEVDDFNVVYGPGWWPFHRGGEPTTVRLAPNTRYWAWRNEYVLVTPTADAAARARLSVYVAPAGAGGVVVTTGAVVDLRAGTAVVDDGCPAHVRDAAQVKADRVLALALAARAQRRRGQAAPVTAYERYRAGEDAS
jgi:hypothetical protein